MRRLVRWVPWLYLAGAVAVEVATLKAPPDGLANLPMALYTFPVVLVGTFVFRREFPFVPGSYYVAHTVYFTLATALLTGALFLLTRRCASPRAQRRES